MELEIAAEWGIPPWELDERMPWLWRDRWVAWKNALHEKQERDNPQASKPGVRKLI